ncbi:MAG: hypothetical protein E7265_03950 [Lachnospiraceae bacterium]|nr:hypothetical protein [Lachnospiraceae bacterium]
MKVWKRYIILTFVCTMIGIITGSLFQSSYFNGLKELMDNYFMGIKSRMEYLDANDNIQILLRTIIKRFGSFVIMWLLGELAVVRIYIAWLCGKFGVVSGFLIIFFLMAYQTRGIIIILLWSMPQIILYGIAYIGSALYIIYGFSRRKGIIITLLSILLAAGCICETYVNPMLMELFV